MAWGKAGSKTLDATATQFDITGLSSESTNLIIHSFPSGASAPRTFEVNGTSGTYDVGNCDGGDAIGHSINYAGAICDQGGSWGDESFTFGFMMSVTGKEKIMIYESIGGNSGTTAPRHRIYGARSNSNTGALTSVTVETAGGSGSIAGSNFSILGSDLTPTSGKPTNVQAGSRWEETDTRKMYHYVAKTATVDDDLSTDKGWVSNTGSWTYNATGGYIDFATITRSQTAQQIYIDVQDSDYLGSGNNLSDSSWVARFKVKTGTQSSSQGGIPFYIGFSNNLGDSGTTQQSATVKTNVNGASNENNMTLSVSRANFETTSSPARVNANVYANTYLPYSTDLYMEMIRNGDVFTLKAYSDEYVTQASSTSVASATVTGISTLRYLKAFTDSEQNQSYTSGGARLYDMKIYNGVTTVPTGNEWKEEGT